MLSYDLIMLHVQLSEWIFHILFGFYEIKNYFGQYKQISI